MPHPFPALMPGPGLGTPTIQVQGGVSTHLLREWGQDLRTFGLAVLFVTPPTPTSSPS